MVNNDCTKVLRSHSLLHSHKKRKESLKTRAVLLIFFFELEIYGMVLLGIHQNNENDSFYCSFSEIFLSENHFAAVLATFCYEYRANASEAAEKITTNQKDNLKCY